MSGTYGMIITDAGAELIAEHILSGTTIGISAVKVGDGGGAQYTPRPSQTGLVNTCWSGAPQSAQINATQPNVIDIQILIPASAEGFTAREVGIFTTDGVMIAVGNVPDTVKTDASDGVSSTLSMLLHLAVADAGVLEFKIIAPEDGYVTPEFYGAVGDGVTDDTAAIKAAMAAAGEGGEVRLKRGATYLVTETLSLLDGQTFDGCGAKMIWRGAATYEGTPPVIKSAPLIISASGSLEAAIPITKKPRVIGNATSSSAGSANDKGFTYITVGQNPGYGLGDRIIIQAARCAMQQESGEFWCGTSTGAGTQTYYAEVLVVNSVTKTDTSEWTIECIGTLLYPYYLPNRLLESDTSPDTQAQIALYGADKAMKLLEAVNPDTNKAYGYYLYSSDTSPLAREHTTVQKVNFLRDVKIKNLHISAEGAGHSGDRASSDVADWKGMNYANTILLSLCEKGVIDNVHIDAHDMGRGFAMRNCWQSEFRNSSYEADYEIYAVYETHTYTNAFTFAACWSCGADSCTTLRAGQSFDTTYIGNTSDSETGKQLTIGCPSLYTTVRACTVEESMDSAATNHSGGWGELFVDCRFINIGRPFCIRSPMTAVKNCTFVARAGNNTAAIDPDGTHYQLGYDDFLLEFAEPACRGGIVEGCSFFGGKGVYINLYVNRFFNYNKANYLTMTEYVPVSAQGTAGKPYFPNEANARPYILAVQTSKTMRPNPPDRKALGINIHDNVFSGCQGALWIKRSDMWNTDGSGNLTDYAKADLGIAFCENKLIDVGKHFFPIYVEAYANGCDFSRNKFIHCIADNPAYYQRKNDAWKGVRVNYLIKIANNNVRMMVEHNTAQECGGDFRYIYAKNEHADDALGTDGNQLRIFAGNRGDTNVAVTATGSDSEVQYLRDGKKTAERYLATTDEDNTKAGFFYDMENGSVDIVAEGTSRVTVDKNALHTTYKYATPACLLRSWCYIRAAQASYVKFRLALWSSPVAATQWDYDETDTEHNYGEDTAVAIETEMTADVYNRIAACWNNGYDELGAPITFSSSVVLLDTIEVETSEDSSDDEPQEEPRQICTRWPAPYNTALTFLHVGNRYIGSQNDFDDTTDPPTGASYVADHDTGVLSVLVSAASAPESQTSVNVFSTIPTGFDTVLETIQRFIAVCEVIQNSTGKAIRVDSVYTNNYSVFQSKKATPEKSTTTAEGEVGEINVFSLHYAPPTQLDLGTADLPWKKLYADGADVGGDAKIVGEVIVDPNGASYPSLKLIGAPDASQKTTMSRLYKNANDIADYGTVLRDYPRNGAATDTSVGIFLRESAANLKDKLLFVRKADNIRTDYCLYGEHNKPTPDELSMLGINQLPAGTVSGSVVAFPDGADDIPVKSLAATIAVNQTGSGTPAPDNWRGFTPKTSATIVQMGKNMYGDGDVEADSTNGYTAFIPLSQPLPPGTYTMSVLATTESTLNKAKIALFATAVSTDDVANWNINANTGQRQSSTFTITRAAYYIRFYSAYSVSDMAGHGAEFKNLQIEVGSTATDYEARNAKTPLTVSFGSAGDVYGGTLNVTTGELTVTHMFVEFNGTQSFSKQYTEEGQYPCFIGPSDIMAGADITADAKCSLLAPATIFPTSNNYGFQLFESSGKKNFKIRFDNMPEDNAGMKALSKTWYDNGTPLAFLCQLAAPVVYNLDPNTVKTLLGTNTICADTGDVAVTYRADIALYIAKMLS